MFKAGISQSLAHLHFDDDALLAVNYIGAGLQTGGQSVKQSENSQAFGGLQGDEMVDGVPAEIGKDGIEKSGGHGREQKQDKGGLEKPDIPEQLLPLGKIKGCGVAIFFFLFHLPTTSLSFAASSAARLWSWKIR